MTKVKPLTRLQRRKVCAMNLVANLQRDKSGGVYVHNHGKTITLAKRSLLDQLEYAYTAGSQAEIERMRALLNEP